MALNNFTNISQAVEDWLNRSGFQDVTKHIEDFIIIGQRRIMREVRIPPMETVVTLSVDSVTEPLPTDYLESKTLTIIQTAGNVTLHRAPFEQVRKFTSVNQPKFFARAGSDLYFGPPPGQTYSIELVYYKELEFISSTVSQNWFSQFAAELILAAALTEAYHFMQETASADNWDRLYLRTKGLLEEQRDKAEWSGGPLSARNDVLMDQHFVP